MASQDSGRFVGSRLKIKRAYKHLNNLKASLSAFIRSDFYGITIEKEPDGTNYIVFDIQHGVSPDAPLMLGDALHNLRSALDNLWYEVVLSCEGTPTKWTRFPIFNRSEELVGHIKDAFEKDRINRCVRDFVVDTVKPYEAGNYALWALHDLNVLDKHIRLIPVHPLLRFTGVRLKRGDEIVGDDIGFFVGGSGRIRLDWGGDLALNHKGRPAATVLFSDGLPYHNFPIVPTMFDIAEEVLSTVKGFEVLLLGPC
jgi:hypothetical protein